MNNGYSSTPASARRRRLREALAGPATVVAPGVFDMVSAKLAERAGFDILFLTGYGLVASYLGLPDAGLANGTDMADRVRQMALVTESALICDADTGYGGLLNVMHTVRSYERAGASAIQLEDQVYPKRCGHMRGRKVVGAAEMEARIRVALDAREDDATVIIARTDARTDLGLDEALRRAERYARAGADVVFVEGPESVEEIGLIARQVPTPTMFNMAHGGRTPVIAPDVLQQLGARLAIYPTAALLAAAQAGSDAYQALSRRELPTGPFYPFAAFSQLMGFEWVEQFDARYRGLDDGQ
ncbi:2,3-dimethylmalate lyase [Pigmentiphaga humi]|uniref:2,3-dimethylmalate lyase n=1 Tax=Pigmentiphaga humi TaxID=2478468 RepID=A0A3P4B0P0_9BURK|nr:isocitrate lyase/PEP mutase family protein [Pigmentiphaga humi]VCU69863.1 2,3-dimethylmalate lyase [Pigmentiphaga humi]